MMYVIDPRKELFDLINFDASKVVQVAGGLLKADRPNLTCMLCTWNGGKELLSEIVNLKFVKNLIRGHNMVHQNFCVKFHRCYAFLQKKRP